MLIKKANKKISKLMEESVYNIGNSSEVGGKYIIKSIKNKINERKKETNE